LKFNFYLAVVPSRYCNPYFPLSMKRAFLLLALIIAVSAPPLRAQPSDWKPVTGRIMTSWAAEVNPASPLPEYPRPQMVRDNWLNLNGLWQYALLPRGQADNIPSAFAGNILVPYAVESALSGVGKTVGKDSLLWYRRTVNVPAKLRKGRLLLHFGAVDWETELYVNGRKGRQPPGRLRPVLLRHYAAPERTAPARRSSCACGTPPARVPSPAASRSKIRTASGTRP
jgi:hypothetical protein